MDSKRAKTIIIFVILSAIILVGIFLRFYNIQNYMHFAGDEGRDAFVVRDMLEKGKLPLLGPSSSAGHFSLGPFYYYLLSIPYLLTYNNPISGAVLIAILSILTIYIIYEFGQDVFDHPTGIFASALFAFSFLAVMHGRWAWNLNPLPFFLIVIFYSIFRIFKESREGNKWNFSAGGKWLIFVFLFTGFAIQLHMTAFILIPAIIILLFIIKPRIRNVVAWILSILAFFASISPMLYFEARHGFENTRNMASLFYGNGSLFTLSNLIKDFSNFTLFGNNFLANNFSFWIALALVIPAIVLMIVKLPGYMRSRDPKWFGVLILLVWGFTIFAGFYFYHGEVFTHYFIVLFPLLPLIVGYLFGWLWKTRYLAFVPVVIIIFLGWVNIKSALSYFDKIGSGKLIGSYGVSIKDERDAVDYIISEASGEPFAVKVVMNDRYGEAIDYLIGLRNYKPIEGSNQLYVIFRTGEDTYRVYEDSEYKDVSQKEMHSLIVKKYLRVVGNP